MAYALGSISNGFEITPEGYIRAATGTVVKDFKPEPCPVPALGQSATGYWFRDGVVWWTKGKVDRVDGRCSFYIVERGSSETYTGRNPMNGTMPALGFR